MAHRASCDNLVSGTSSAQELAIQSELAELVVEIQAGAVLSLLRWVVGVKLIDTLSFSSWRSFSAKYQLHDMSGDDARVHHTYRPACCLECIGPEINRGNKVIALALSRDGATTTKREL